MDSVGTLTFNRPQARNALTWDMYDALVEACDRSMRRRRLRVLVIRGAGRRICGGHRHQSVSRLLDSGDDGVAYERRLDAVIDRLERVTPSHACRRRWYRGRRRLRHRAGVRSATLHAARAQFGVPVARTLGNCLSIANTARLVDLIGPARVKDLLFTGRLSTPTRP